jgi:hypothetical protein
MVVRFLYIILLISSATIFAQDAITQTDSLNTPPSADSIFIRTLAVPTAADSLEAARLRAEAAAQATETEVDTLNLTRGMRDAIAKTLKLQQLMPLSYLMHRENNHFFAPFEQKRLLRWNGFTLHPGLVNQTRQYQSYAPLFTTSSTYSGHRFINANYNLPAAFTETWLGIGDYDMTHAVVRFHKALLLGIPKLAVEASYSGMAGQWYDQTDETANFNGHLCYATSWGDVHLYHTAINEETGSYVLHPSSATTGTVTHHDIQTALLWNTPFFETGYRYQTTALEYNAAEETRKFHSLLIGKKIRILNNELTLTIEPTWLDDDFMPVNTIDHRFSSSRLVTSNSLHMADDNWDLYSYGQLPIFSWIAATWQACMRNEPAVQDDAWLNAVNADEKFSAAAGVTLFPQSLNLSMLAGKTKTDYRRDFVQINSHGSVPWRNYSLDLTTWSRYLPDPGSWLPTWQLNTDAALSMHLEHNNTVSLGANWLYTSDYFTKKTESGVESAYPTYAQNLDMYVKIQVSRLFDIEGRAVNVLNNTTLFNMLGTVPQTHYNVSLRWFFKN